jgi:DNA invertase Pin-like site-specific DNA recombinase
LFYFYHSFYLLLVFYRFDTLDLQRDALKLSGCEKIIVDKLSGTLSERPGLTKIKELLRRGDTLVVWRLDRLGRSLKDLIEWMNYLDKEGVGLKSLQESIDTGTATGKLVFHLFGALSEFERNLIKERTMAGLTAARARGRKGGRPPRLDKDKRALVVSLYNEKKLSVKKICEMMNITKPTLYRYVQESMGK